jgi:hypothetical protein
MGTGRRKHVHDTLYHTTNEEHIELQDMMY